MIMISQELFIGIDVSKAMLDMAVHSEEAVVQWANEKRVLRS